MCAVLVSNATFFFIHITISILFPDDDYYYFMGVYAHSYSFWTTEFGFLTLGNFSSAIPHSWDVFAPETFCRILDWARYHRTPLCRIVFSFRLSYRVVQGFTNNYPCGIWYRALSTCPQYVSPLFGNPILNDSWFLILAWRKTHFHFCFWFAYEFTYVMIYHNLMWE